MKKQDKRTGQNAEKAREKLQEYIRLGKERRLAADQNEDDSEEELVFSIEDLQELNGEVEEPIKEVIKEDPKEEVIKEDKYKSMFETLQNDFKALNETVIKLKSEPPKEKIVEKVVIREKTSDQIRNESMMAKLRSTFY